MQGRPQHGGQDRHICVVSLASDQDTKTQIVIMSFGLSTQAIALATRLAESLHYDL